MLLALGSKIYVTAKGSGETKMSHVNNPAPSIQYSDDEIVAGGDLLLLQIRGVFLLNLG